MKHELAATYYIIKFVVLIKYTLYFIFLMMKIVYFCTHWCLMTYLYVCFVYVILVFISLFFSSSFSDGSFLAPCRFIRIVDADPFDRVFDVWICHIFWNRHWKFHIVILYFKFRSSAWRLNRMRKRPCFSDHSGSPFLLTEWLKCDVVSVLNLVTSFSV